MTTHRATKPAASQPVERALMAGLVLAVLAGVGWIAGMIYTVMGW
ncbi:morphogenic membrane protein MmpA [Streptomyces sp. NPDC048825]